VWVDVFEDDYERGEGKMVHGFAVDGIGRAETLPMLIDAINRKLGYGLAWKEWEAVDDGRVGASVLVDRRGERASKAMIAEWRRGRRKLRAAQILARVELVDVHTPTAEELGLQWRKAI
jgi:hypothetical protein